jgi:autotransporter-associated beta strand protein
MSNEFVARNGVIALNNSSITGSLGVTNGITGSLSGSHVGDTTGTASWAQNATTSSYILNAASSSYTLSASYALTASNVNGGTTNTIPLWSNTTSLSSSIIYQTAGNIGINMGTATPAARLQVSGTVNVANIRGSGSLTTSSIFTVDGAAGRLFSVNDSLSGSLFSVNTIAGLPVVEAFSDNTVRIGQFGQRALFVSQSSVGIGIEATTAKLHISASTGGIFELDGTGSANVLYVSSSGRISVGRTDPGGRLDIAYAGALNDPTILLGADDNANTVRTNNSSSLARIGLIHYNKTATASAILIASSTATANTVFIGGGSAYLNSSTAIQFYTAPTTASLTGFQRISIDSTGNVNILSGSFTVTSGSIVDFQVTDTGTKIGNAVTDIHTITGSLNISGSSSYSGSISVNSGSIRIASGSIFTPKVIGNTAVPVVVLGTGAGSVPAGGISGSDVAGILRLTTGTGPAANNPIGTVTFASAYSTVPYVLITPGNYSASLVTGGVSGTFTTASTTGFTIFASGPASLRGSTAYTWSYHVFG